MLMTLAVIFFAADAARLAFEVAVIYGRYRRH